MELFLRLLLNECTKGAPGEIMSEAILTRKGM